jgi:two-component system heavy metal sensor histidine kinase CusS
MEPFGQVHAATVRNQEGTGLGLAIVRSLMEQHGGSAEIDSVLGAWTRVTLTFPEHRLSSDRAQARLPGPNAVAVGGSG